MGPADQNAVGWVSPDGETWPGEAPADFDSLVPAATPDAMPDPDGGYRMHYMHNGQFGLFEVARSDDGRVWGEGSVIYRSSTGFNVSVDRAPDGTWWLYFNQNEAGCLE
jgi:hypothetical protein